MAVAVGRRGAANTVGLTVPSSLRRSSSPSAPPRDCRWGNSLVPAELQSEKGTRPPFELSRVLWFQGFACGCLEAVWYEVGAEFSGHCPEQQNCSLGFLRSG